MAQLAQVPVTLEEVDAATLKEWLDAGEALLVDVREPAEYVAAHIPAARLVPASKFDPEMLAAQSPGRLVLHCASGQRAWGACQKLLACGCGDVFLFRGGVAGWREAGYEVAGTGKEPLSVLRQVQVTVGTMIVFGTVLGHTVAAGWLILPTFCGLGLLMAGLTGHCPLATAIARMPHNQRGAETASCCTK